ncbi:hypothetical protein FALBO_5573 [Fusarium albosuccineum]|uniref:Uncharacterized protein n=1 Tax=Fusarium albosuccineum TaxID=1237068 RepID=A0A8H4PE52_9HYPO|nr:hypothetical protein FALBO_5573 [Fusarium albosuccineum]
MAHIHSYTCGCPWAKGLASKSLQQHIRIDTEVPTTSKLSTSQPAHTHSPTCGCSWYSGFVSGQPLNMTPKKDAGHSGISTPSGSVSSVEAPTNSNPQSPDGTNSDSETYEEFVGSLPRSITNLLGPEAAHTHSDDCGCPSAKTVPSGTVNIDKVAEPAQVSAVSHPDTGPHIHGPNCGCSWMQTFAKSQGQAAIKKLLDEAEEWGDLKSAFDTSYDYDHPEMPKFKPNHRTRTARRPCLKNGVPIVYWEDRKAVDDGDPDLSDEDEKFRVEHKLLDKKDKQVRFNHISEATCILTGQSIPSTPKTPQSALRWSRKHLKLAMKKAYNALSSKPTDEDEVEEKPKRPSEFHAQDLDMEKRLEKATDICMANERASIIRGALDFYMYICLSIDSKAANKVAEIKCHLGRMASVGSYVGDEREFAKNGGIKVSLVPEEMYRNKETAMSWCEVGRNGLYNTTRFSKVRERDDAF